MESDFHVISLCLVESSVQRLACHDESCPSWACQPVLLSRDLGYLLLANLSSCGKPRVRYQGPKAAMQHSTETRERTSSSSSYMKACGWIVLSTNRMVSPPCFSASLSSASIGRRSLAWQTLQSMRIFPETNSQGSVIRSLCRILK